MSILFGQHDDFGTDLCKTTPGGLTWEVRPAGFTSILMDDGERAKKRRKAYFRMIGESLDQRVPESDIISDLFAAALSYGGISYPQARAAVRMMVEAGSERWVVYRLEDSVPPAKIIEELVAAGYKRYEAEDFLVKIADLWAAFSFGG